MDQTRNPAKKNPIKRVARGVGQAKRTLTRFIKKPAHAPGTSPGTLVPAPEKKSAISRITLIAYDQDHYLKKEIESIEEAFVSFFCLLELIKARLVIAIQERLFHTIRVWLRKESSS